MLEQAARKGSASSAKNGHGCAHHRMGVKGGEHVVFNAEGALDLSRYLAALERWSAAILAMYVRFPSRLTYLAQLGSNVMVSMLKSRSAAGWLDISPAALRKLRAELEQHDKGVLDEMGVATLHVGYADAFFPGTSVLHKRARYLFFVPWTFLWLASQRGATPERVRSMKEKVEHWLTARLRLKEKGKGIIGGQVWPRAPAQPPDFAYWSALRVFGLYQGVSRTQLLARWDRKRVVRGDDVRLGEEDVAHEPLGCFHVPPMPRWWMADDADITFQLTRKEALFLQERLATLDPPCLLSMAASRLGKKARPRRRSELWEDEFMRRAAEALDRQRGPIARRPVSVLAAVDRARCASDLAELVRAIYAALVERLYEQDLRDAGRIPLPEDIEQYRSYLKSYWDGDDTIVRAACELSLDDLAADIELPDSLREIFALVQERIRMVKQPSHVEAHLMDDVVLERFTRIERRRKGMRARLPLRDGRMRRATLATDAPQVSGIGYRWRVVSQLLCDIQEGLVRGQ